MPPGVSGLHPQINPAGHAFETQMVEALRAHFEIRSVGLLPFNITGASQASDASPGLPHALCLVERPPELFHRWRSLQRLKRAYQTWRTQGWEPDAVLVYNLSPVYNGFLHWLGRQPASPRRILLLADSPQLGRPLSPWKRLRYHFKPLAVPDEEMIKEFAGCIALSQATQTHFAGHGIPWLWMPGGCTAEKMQWREPTEADPNIVFGYFGALAPHTGVMPLAEIFLAFPLPNRLYLCGYGKLADDLRAMSRQGPRVKFQGLLPSRLDCLQFAQVCDVLVNPRPAGWGNENNFPSKIFQYALAGRAILSSRLSGVDEVLGDAGCYFDPADFVTNLRRAIESLAQTPREELRRRGAALRQRIQTEYSWERQAGRMADFVKPLLGDRPVP